ncbi:MAG TPA: nucleotidyltransferase domain-containing protein [Puia sp.]
MLPSGAILSSIKSRVHAVVPDAKVLLFGSRAYGTPTEESDWDILVLTSQPVNSELKKNIHTSLFPLSVEIGSFINTLAVQENEWLNNAAYYSLQQTVNGRMIEA